MSDKNKNVKAENAQVLKNDDAEQRKNAIKLIIFVFAIPLIVVAISLATR